MKQFDGTNYNELYPKTTASQTTCSVSGISSTNVNGALSELFTSVSNGKTQLASAITAKGVSTSASDSFSTMATNISKIPTGATIITGTFTGTGTGTVIINNAIGKSNFCCFIAQSLTQSSMFNIMQASTLGTTLSATSHIYNVSAYISGRSATSFFGDATMTWDSSTGTISVVKEEGYVGMRFATLTYIYVAW